MTLEHVGQVEWSAFAQPAGNAADAVPQALRRLAAAASEDDATDAYRGVLRAVGNDEAATYFPVVVPTIQFLGAILAAPADTPAAAALEVLTDLATSFAPEPGHERVIAATGSEVALRDVLADEMRTLAGLLDAVAADAQRPPSTRAMASDLRQVL